MLAGQIARRSGRSKDGAHRSDRRRRLSVRSSQFEEFQSAADGDFAFSMLDGFPIPAAIAPLCSSSCVAAEARRARLDLVVTVGQCSTTAGAKKSSPTVAPDFM